MTAVAKNASVLFLIIFAGQFFYIYLVASAMMPAFLGGYFSIACILGSVFLLKRGFLFAQLKMLSSREFFVLILPFVVFLLTVLIQTLWSAANPMPGREGAVYQSMNLLLYSSVLFVVGFGLALDGEAAIKLKKFVFLGMFIIILSYVMYTGSLFYNVGHLAKDAGVDDAFGTYQTIARSVLLVGLLVLAVRCSAVARIVWLGINLFLLFVIGARTELYAMVAIVPLYTFLTLIGSGEGVARNFTFVGLLGALFIVSLVVFTLVGIKLDFDMRQFAIFSLGSDASWSSRIRLDQLNKEFIADNPIWGSHGSHFLQGGAGTYIHGWFSVWQNYGLLAFLMFLYMTLVLLIWLVYLFLIKGYRDNSVIVGICIGMVVLIAASLSKSFVWEVIYLSWGITVGLVVRRNHILRTPGYAHSGRV